MPTTLHISIFLLITINISVSQQYEEILASDNVCFSAKDYRTSTLFNAPNNGTISGIRLDHKSGNVSCGEYATYPDTNWGCRHDKNTTKFFTVFLRVTSTDYHGIVYYPTRQTEGVSIANYSSSGDFGDCDRGCTFADYNVSGYNAMSAPNFTLIEPSYNVTTNDLFMLQYTEACCSIGTNDNRGKVCAAVYFIYHNPTSSPTAEPTVGPTHIPSRTPAVKPSINVTGDYGVFVKVKYTLNNVKLPNFLEFLSNVTSDALIGNLSESTMDCIGIYTQNISNVTQNSVTINVVVVTCNLQTAETLKDHYDNYVEEQMVNSINIGNNPLYVTKANVDLEVNIFDKVDGANPDVITTTIDMNHMTDNKNENYSKSLGIAYLLVIIAVVVLLLICCIVGYHKRKRLRKRKNSNDLQLGLLDADGTKGLFGKDDISVHRQLYSNEMVAIHAQQNVDKDNGVNDYDAFRTNSSGVLYTKNVSMDESDDIPEGMEVNKTSRSLDVDNNVAVDEFIVSDDNDNITSGADHEEDNWISK